MKKIIALLLSFMLFLQPCCSALAAIQLPGALQSIEAEAFLGVEGLDGNVVLPDGVENIGDAAFGDTDVFSMELPDATTQVGSGILSGSNAAYVVVKNPTAVLAEDAFAGVGAVVGREGSTAERVADPGQFFPSEHLLWKDGFAYIIQTEGVAVVAFPAEEVTGDVKIPGTVAGYQVKGATPYAFTGLEDITSIEVPFAASELPADQITWPDAAFTHVTVEWPDAQLPGAQRISFEEEKMSLIPGDNFVLEEMPLTEELPEGRWYVSAASDNEEVVSVDEADYGTLITAEAAGEAFVEMIFEPMDDEDNIITGENGDGAYYAMMKIEVAEPSIQIDIKEDPVVLKAGWTYDPDLTITTPSRFTNAQLICESSDPESISVVTGRVIQAHKPGEATITVSAKLDGYNGAADVTAEASYTVIVEAPAFTFNHPTLHTYLGYEYDLEVVDLPADAASVQWESQEGLITVYDDGHAVVGDKRGSDVITCTITCADGTVMTEQIPVSIKLGLVWAEDAVTDHNGILPEFGWDVRPNLIGDWWDQHKGTVRFTAEMVDDTSIVEGRSVVAGWDEITEDYGNRKVVWPLMIAGYPGNATIRFNAGFEYEDELDESITPSVLDEQIVTVEVKEPEINAWLDSDVYDVNAGEHVAYYGYDAWIEGDCSYEQSFASSDESVFVAGSNGTIIPKGEGSAELTYTVTSYGVEATATAQVNVYGYNLSLQPAEMTLTMGQSAMLMAVMPENAQFLGSNYHFYSEQPEVADVTQTGQVIARTPGTARILFETEFEGKQTRAECFVTVEPAEGSGLELNAYRVQLHEGASCQLTPKTTGTVKKIEWTSTNADVVSVDANGLLLVEGQGWCYPDYEIITCAVTYKNNTTETVSCMVYAPEPLAHMTNLWGHYWLEAGEQHRFFYTPSFTAPYTADDFTIRFESGDESIVTVDEHGIMTAVSDGVAQMFIVCELDGTEVFRGWSLVNVGTPAPAITDETGIEFVHDLFFVPAPPEGEDAWTHLGVSISDPLLWRYYYVHYSEDADPEGAIEVDEGSGDVRITGEGEADVYAYFVPHGDSGVMEANPTAHARVVVDTPELAMTLEDVEGHAKKFRVDENGMRHLDVGDVLTVEVKGVPEEVEHRFVNWDYNGHAFVELERTDRKLVLVAANPTDAHVYMDTELVCDQWFDLSAEMMVDGPQTDYRFPENIIFLTKGESQELHVEYETVLETFRSADPSVAKIINTEDGFRVAAVNYGHTILTAETTVMGENGMEDVTAVCFVHVVEDNWDLTGMDEIADVMYIGEDYPLIAWVHNMGVMGPSLEFAFSDADMADIWFNEDDHEFWATPKKAGETTVTVTATKNGVTKKLSKPVMVLDHPLRFDTGSFIGLVRGTSCEVSLINETGRNITSVAWSTVQPAVAEVAFEGDNAHTAVVMASSRDQDQCTLLNAVVTFEDGTTEIVSARVDVLSGGHIDFRVRLEDELHLSTEVWGEHNTEVTVWLDCETNANIGDGADRVEINWLINNEISPEEAEEAGIIRFLGYEEEGSRNGLRIEAMGPEDFMIWAHADLFDAEGDYLGGDHAGMHVMVHQPEFEICNVPDEIYVTVGDYRHVSEFGMYLHRDGVAPVGYEKISSNDERIATVDVHGNIQGAAAGETDICFEYVINGVSFEAWTHVIVEGVELILNPGFRTMEAGSMIRLIPYEDDRDYVVNHSWWSTSNEGVALVTADGTVYAKAPGSAVIGYHVDAEEIGHVGAYCTIEVVGETAEVPAFRLDQETLSIRHNETGRFRIVWDGEGEADEDSIVWTVKEGHVSVDGEGNVTANDNYVYDMYDSVTVEATINGERYSASGTVVVLARKLRVSGDQFGPGRWYGMGVDEWLPIWETYTVLGNGGEAEIEITSDDPSIVEVQTFENGETFLRAVKQGQAWVHYTATLESGECETLSALIRVEEDTMPESIAPAYEVQVVPLWDERAGLDFVVTPDYTGCDLIFESDNPAVLTFEDEHNNEMTLHGPGMATVHVYSPENTALKTDVRVMVLDAEAIELRPVEDRYDPWALANGETVQLGFFYQGMLMKSWGDGVNVHYEPHRNYDDMRVIAGDDLTLKVLWPGFDESIHHWVDLVFESGLRVSCKYEFIVDDEIPYFYMAHEEDDRVVDFVGNAGDSIRLNVITNLDEENCTLTWKSANSAIADYVVVEESEEGADRQLMAKKIGKTHITFTLSDGETTLKYVYPVNVIAPEMPDFWINSENDVSAIQVDEELQLYVGYNNQHSNPPAHFFTSSDESILKPVLDEDGNQFYGLFRGVAEGEVTVTATAAYGHGEDARTATAQKTFYVLPNQADVELGSGVVELRPGQTKDVVLWINKEGVKSVTCTSTNPEMLEAVVDYDGEDDPYICLTGLSAEEDAGFEVVVTFDDGLVRTLYCYVEMVSDEEVWISGHADGVTMSTSSWSWHDQRSDVWLTVDTNADFSEGMDQYSVEWRMEDEEVARIVSTNGDDVELEAAGEGETHLVAMITVTNNQGEVIAEGEAWIYVEVVNPWLEISPWHDGEPVDTLYMSVDEEQRVHWFWDGDHFAEPQQIRYYSDDDTIARVTRDESILAVAPGTTTIHQTAVFADGKEVEGQVQVTVRGTKVSFNAYEITLDLDSGKSTYLKPVVDVPYSLGWIERGSRWENSDDSVVWLNESTGELIPLSVGTATLTYLVQATDNQAWWREASASCHVTVTSENAPFTLNETRITLYGDETVQLEPVYDEALFGELVSVRWDSEGDGIEVTEDGVVSARSARDVRYGLIRCEATFADAAGARIVADATCHVTNETASIRPNDQQYGDGRYMHMDYVSEMYSADSWSVLRSGAEVELSFESTDETIVTVDENGTIYAHSTPGEADVIMTLHVVMDGERTGEIHQRRLHLLVGQQSYADSVAPAYDVFVVPREWEQHYLPLAFTPEYSDFYVEAYSQDESIVSFDEEEGSTEMFFHDHGPVTIDVIVPFEDDKNIEAQVLVFEEDHFFLTADTDRLAPNQSVQMRLDNLYGMELTENEIEVVEYMNYYRDSLSVTQDGVVTLLVNDPNDEGYNVWARVRANSGHEFQVCYTFWPELDQPYVYLSPKDSTGDHYTLAEGHDVWLTVYSDRTDWNPEDLTITSSNPDVMTAEWINGEDAIRVVGVSEGEAEVILTMDDERSCSFPIKVIIPTELHTRLSIGWNGVVRVGDAFEAYTSAVDEDLERWASIFYHDYDSSDGSVLRNLADYKEENDLDPDDMDWMVFEAVGEGTAIITSTAWWGEGEQRVEDVQKMVVQVLPAVGESEPQMLLLAGSEAQGAEEHIVARRIADTHEEVILDTYPDNFTADQNETVAKLKAYGADVATKAIVAHQGVPGTLPGFKAIRSNRKQYAQEQPLLVVGLPQESLADVTGVADIAISANEIGQSDTIAQLLEKWGIDVFVHYSFPRHMALESVAVRSQRLQAYCQDNGIEYLTFDAPDPVEEGLEAANTFIEEHVAEVAAEYEGKKVAFFCTNCGMQASLQQAVLNNENAYYPQPCCPSPYHGFPETLGLSLKIGEDEAALRAVATALNAHGAAGRFSTWETSVNGVIMEAAAEYALGWMDGSITSTNDASAVEALIKDKVSAAVVTTEDYDNYYTVLLAPVDFNDYL